MNNHDIDLTSEQLFAVIAHYDGIVRRNTTADYNALEAVANDQSGETVYEVWDTANDLGKTLTEADRENLQDWLDDYRGVLRDELGLGTCMWCQGTGCQSCGWTGSGDTHEADCDCTGCVITREEATTTNRSN